MEVRRRALDVASSKTMFSQGKKNDETEESLTMHQLKPLLLDAVGIYYDPLKCNRKGGCQVASER